MSTNYYLHYPSEPRCNHCGHEPNKSIIHIGKSSYGWKFSLHVTEEIKSLDDWKKEWSKNGAIIKNEYDEIITQEDMLEIITERGNGRWCKKGYDLKAHDVDGIHCIGAGDGPWDYILGDFS